MHEIKKKFKAWNWNINVSRNHIKHKEKAVKHTKIFHTSKNMTGIG